MSVVEPVIDPAAVAAAFREDATRESERTLAGQLAYALTRGPDGRRGPDPDQQQLKQVIQRLGGWGQLYAALCRISGLPGFVGPVLLISMNLGAQSVASEFVTEAERLRPRWPQSFRTAFRGVAGGTPVGDPSSSLNSLMACAQTIRNTLGDGDLPGAHQRAMATLDFLEFMAAEIDYTRTRHSLYPDEKHARPELAKLDPEELQFRRDLLTRNLTPAQDEHAQWKTRAG
ncbi:MAG: hypothetical protein ACFCUP_09740 [Actinomycetales bacterium]